MILRLMNTEELMEWDFSEETRSNATWSTSNPIRLDLESNAIRHLSYGTVSRILNLSAMWS
jgi:hypothetical protein